MVCHPDAARVAAVPLGDKFNPHLDDPFPARLRRIQGIVDRRIDNFNVAKLTFLMRSTAGEIAFNDALTKNLRRGRFLLLIVGDGIREGVEAISEYLQIHAGLHFSLGLIELPIFAMPDGGRLIVPRVLARTALITRTVVAMPDGYALSQVSEDEGDADSDPDRTALADEQQQFWAGFLRLLTLDDPEQRIPKPARQGYLNFNDARAVRILLAQRFPEPTAKRGGRGIGLNHQHSGRHGSECHRRRL
ncbi:hypothetical protein [Paraburkholderia sp.]|uniref:hypothetical protein n=1 Tax=Paraburkholderia sp. TaxID=1926495 RepID=UPI003C7B0401